MSQKKQARKRTRRHYPYGPGNAMRDISDMTKLAVAGTVGIGVLGTVASVFRK